MKKKVIIVLMLLAGLLLASFSLFRLSPSSSLADRQTNQQDIPPEVGATDDNTITTTHASRLAIDNDEFASVDLCITGRLTKQQAEQQLTQNANRLSPEHRPTLLISQPAITITLTGLTELPTDVIDIYVNTAVDGSSQGQWQMINQIGFSDTADSVDIRAELPGLENKQGWHLVVVEARYEDKPRSVWSHLNDCGQVLYNADVDEFRSVGDAS